ncbi:MAG: 50S ribosomal protein L25, partial [Candidatus Auribacterota bacterium]|nr:50S ribosomal protein L25 [Candidatus Auribacterota bacterium]
MAQLTIAVKVRSEIGGNRPRQIRRNGLLPVVLYGGNEETLSLILDQGHLKQTAGMLRENQIVSLEVELDGKKIKKTAMIKEIQIDHLRRKILHIDFLQIALDEKLSVSIPIVAIGDAIGVTQEGGILEHILREIEIECLPADLPEKIEMDVSALGVGDTLHVKDIPPMAGIEILTEDTLGIIT